MSRRPSAGDNVGKGPSAFGRGVATLFTGLGFPWDTSAMGLIDNDEAARRLARAIASDISLYNEEKIVNGITNDNLFTSLAEEIEEGRALFKKRVSPELYPKNYYDRALIDIVIKNKGHIKSKLW